ncbi:hypothetical protein A3C89_01075 [Candidatus Kaiserbacteria bacterium RIFCSPHIGHO2_02_FULL_50_50]|uniref:Uncharacterized protein n=1 Tax=Candidatus Kaiserbacteria bacterium RIFCSPHIGHO2_02_FULL_50_50 TaxID=1798492 RepID=A0A1F6DDP3_9BACT|nr:MAG: hypothetical protein A3C89_01075 [Candidatus Kaiserbacteria bacterium RIFCSPHIGHO2_02_FULL_50_50]OGG88714.1 MAG: hypothetical protein A3G62_00475 [Candidatus Kaiserbacteria bacterium RIFCSPLOWO2_12_FULL_50_10]
MLARHASDADRAEADAIIEYKLGHARPRVIGGIVALRLLFETVRMPKMARRAGSERFMLMWLYLTTLSDMLDSMSASLAPDELRDRVHASLLLRSISVRILALLHQARMPSSRIRNVEMLLEKLREHCIREVSGRSAQAKQLTSSACRNRHRAKMHLCAELFMHMLYPLSALSAQDVQTFATFMARTQMIGDVADLSQDILLKNHDNAACMKLLLFPKEYEAMLAYAHKHPREKVNPRTLRRHVPYAYYALLRWHAQLGNVMVANRGDPACRLLRWWGSMFFLLYPNLRNCIYRIAPHRAVF